MASSSTLLTPSVAVYRIDISDECGGRGPVAVKPPRRRRPAIRGFTGTRRPPDASGTPGLGIRYADPERLARAAPDALLCFEPCRHTLTTHSPAERSFATSGAARSRDPTCA